MQLTISLSAKGARAGMQRRAEDGSEKGSNCPRIIHKMLR